MVAGQSGAQSPGPGQRVGHVGPPFAPLAERAAQVERVPYEPYGSGAQGEHAAGGHVDSFGNGLDATADACHRRIMRFRQLFGRAVRLVRPAFERAGDDHALGDLGGQYRPAGLQGDATFRSGRVRVEDLRVRLVHDVRLGVDPVRVPVFGRFDDDLVARVQESNVREVGVRVVARPHAVAGLSGHGGAGVVSRTHLVQYGLARTLPCGQPVGFRPGGDAHVGEQLAVGGRGFDRRIVTTQRCHLVRLGGRERFADRFFLPVRHVGHVDARPPDAPDHVGAGQDGGDGAQSGQEAADVPKNAHTDWYAS